MTRNKERVKNEIREGVVEEEEGKEQDKGR